MSRAGRYRTLVDFEQDVGTKNATSGQQEESWQSVATGVWCDLTPLTGREFIAAQQLMTTITHMLKTRYNPTLSLTPRMRAKVGTRVLHISHILNIGERNIELEMHCMEAQ